MTAIQHLSPWAGPIGVDHPLVALVGPSGRPCSRRRAGETSAKKTGASKPNRMNGKRVDDNGRLGVTGFRPGVFWVTPIRKNLANLSRVVNFVYLPIMALQLYLFDFCIVFEVGNNAIWRFFEVQYET